MLTCKIAQNRHFVNQKGEKMYSSKDQLLKGIEGKLEVTNKGIDIKDKAALQADLIDNIIYTLCLSDDDELKHFCANFIWEIARALGIHSASIDEFYRARGKNKFHGFTTPAMNLRVLGYDMARCVIRSAKKINAGAFIFEIAKSEMGYTNQPAYEYTSACLAAAIREGFEGPIFIQGDHFQAKADKFKADPEKEVNGLKSLIDEAIHAGFYNIDIDSSTLVDLSKPTRKEQQRFNYEVAAELTKFIRSLQPRGVSISVGGEIGEVGHENSNPEELEAYMSGYNELVGKDEGISKVSVQTGTSHGGVVKADGTIAEVKLDFDTLKVLSEEARKKYGMGGAVQHGASTLPDDMFHKFPEVETLEIHLATGFQNIVYDSKHFPDDLRQRMYKWCHENCAGEKKEKDTEDQFIYKTRKKALGPFKKDIMNLPKATREAICKELEEKFDFLFDQLKIKDSAKLIKKFVKAVDIPKQVDAKVKAVKRSAEEMDGAD